MANLKCKNCGANRNATAEKCEYCGNEFPALTINPTELQQIESLLKGWNDSFRQLKRKSEDRGVAILYAVLGVTILATIGLRIWADWGWLALVGVGLAGFVLAVAVSIGWGDKWAEQAVERHFDEQILPQIQTYLAESNITQWQLKEIAQSSLGKNQPLRSLLLASNPDV